MRRRLCLMLLSLLVPAAIWAAAVAAQESVIYAPIVQSVAPPTVTLPPGWPSPRPTTLSTPTP